MMKNLLAGVDNNGIWQTLGKSGSEGINVQNPVLLGGLGGKSGIWFFQKFIPSLLSLAIVVGALLFFFNIIMGAIQWISSGGDKEAVTQARKRISNALIGIIILFAVFAIAALVEYFFSVDILTLDIERLIIR